MLTEDEAVEQFQNRMAKFCQHIFNIRWRYGACRELREKFTDECLIHIDFSERYVCKYARGEPFTRGFDISLYFCEASHGKRTPDGIVGSRPFYVTERSAEEMP